jgi:hypothetical protein
MSFAHKEELVVTREGVFSKVILPVKTRELVFL